MKKGFTLIELLSVIVILSIILVIAVPQVIKIIRNVEIKSYKSNEEMLTNAAKKYVLTNSVSLVENVPTPINYTTLRDAGYISKMYDFKDKSECIKSKIYVTKSGDDYTYNSGIVCNNYITLSTFNMIVNGDFSVDANHDNVADNFSSGSTNLSLSNNIQSFKPISQYSGLSHQSINNLKYKVGDKLFASAKIKSNIASTQIVLYCNNPNSWGGKNVSVVGEFNTLNLFFTVTGTANVLNMYIQENATSNFSDVQTKEWYLLNLTNMGLETETDLQKLQNLIDNSI